MTDDREAATTVTDGTSIVELTVTKIDVTDLGKGGEELIAWKAPQQNALEVAQAWAQVRGYDRLLPALDYMLGAGRAPKSGFHVLINKPTGLMFYAVWPWAPASAHIKRLAG